LRLCESEPRIVLDSATGEVWYGFAASNSPASSALLPESFTQAKVKAQPSQEQQRPKAPAKNPAGK
jgi:hypothetical protein